MAVLKSFVEEDPFHSSIINFDDDLISLFADTVSSIDDDDDDDPQS